MDLKAGEMFVLFLFMGQFLIYFLIIVPTLKKQNKFSSYHFWVNPFYYPKSLSAYYDICKAEKKSMIWLHISNSMLLFLLLSFVMVLVFDYL